MLCLDMVFFIVILFGVFWACKFMYFSKFGKYETIISRSTFSHSLSLEFQLKGQPFPGLNWGLLHCRQILYHLSHRRSPSTHSPHSTWNSALCACLDGRVVWERIDAFICLAESHHCSPETTIILLIGYIPIQNKRFETWKKRKQFSLYQGI